MLVRKTYKAESRKDYGNEFEECQGLNTDQLQTGCLMRIADATEVMAKRYQDLIDDRDRYKMRYEEEKAQSHRYWLRMCALKGVITKLKGKVQALQNP